MMLRVLCALQSKNHRAYRTVPEQHFLCQSHAKHKCGGEFPWLFGPDRHFGRMSAKRAGRSADHDAAKHRGFDCRTGCRRQIKTNLVSVWGDPPDHHGPAPQRGPVLPSVGVENRAGSALGVRHLIETHGHTHIAFVNVRGGAYTLGNRYDGYKKAMRDAGLAP